MKIRVFLCSLAAFLLLSGSFAAWLFLVPMPEGPYATASQAEENGYLVVRDLYRVENMRQWHRFRVRTWLGIPSELRIVQDFGTEDGRMFETTLLSYDRDGYHLTDSEGNETSARYLTLDRYPMGKGCRASSVVLKNDRSMDHDAWRKMLISSVLPPADPEQSTLYRVAFSRMGKRSLKTLRENTEYTEHLGWNEPLYAELPTTLEDICRWSDTIVKAELLFSEAFGRGTQCCIYRVLTDYTGNTTERIIHVYEDAYATFQPGKTYYLFLGGMKNPLYPHTVYARSYHGFVLSEGDAGLHFLGYQSFGVENIPDMDAWLRDVVKAGTYDTEEEMLRQEDAETAYRNADHVWLVTVDEIRDIANPYVATAEYTLDQVLKGEAQEEYHQTFPADAKPGDQYILLFRQDGESINMYSTANFLYPADSRDGRRILRLWEREA